MESEGKTFTESSQAEDFEVVLENAREDDAHFCIQCLWCFTNTKNKTSLRWKCKQIVYEMIYRVNILPSFEMDIECLHLIYKEQVNAKYTSSM